MQSEREMYSGRKSYTTCAAAAALALLLASALALAPRASADTILNSSVLRVVADNDSVGNVDHAFFPAGSPVNFHDTQTAFTGSALTKGTYDLTNDDFIATFSGARSGLQYSFNNTFDDYTFTVTKDTMYCLTGSITSDPASTQFMLRAFLSDQTAYHTLFWNWQETDLLGGTHFELGQAKGVDHHELSGSLTGTLLANHVYEFSFQTTIKNPGSDAGAAFTGGYVLSLDCGCTTCVPLPSTALAGGALLGGLLLLHRSRRRASLLR
jgi:hypothetical protein